MAPIHVSDKQMADARRVLSWGVVQSVLEKVGGERTDVVDMLEQSVFINIQQCEDWSATFLAEMISLNMGVKKIKDLNDHMNDYLKQCFRQRFGQLPPIPETKLTEYTGTPYESHITVLRRHSSRLTRDLRLEGSDLLDKLCQDHAMSESDRQKILAKDTTKRKNEDFINFLCTNFTTEDFKANVLPVMSLDDFNADLAKLLSGDLEASISSQSLKCNHCKMVGLCDLQGLSEALYEQGAIPESLKHDLSIETISSSNKWNDLLQQVNENKLLKGLEKSQPHLAKELKHRDHPVLYCCCDQLTKSEIATVSVCSRITREEEGFFESTIQLISVSHSTSLDQFGQGYFDHGYFVPRHFVPRPVRHDDYPPTAGAYPHFLFEKSRKRTQEINTGQFRPSTSSLQDDYPPTAGKFPHFIFENSRKLTQEINAGAFN